MFDSTTASTTTQVEAITPRGDALRRVAFVGSFPPRRCGIATFTADMSQAVCGARPGATLDIVAINDRPEGHAYGEAVSVTVDQHTEADYIEAARRLNRARVDVVSIQHEFGIFGGPAGAHILRFCEELRCPLVTTFHTILEAPNDDQRRVMNRLIALSARVVVMSQKGRAILRKTYAAPDSKIEVIAHGAPDRPRDAEHGAKRRLGLEGRDVALTFGLLSPNKGIESVIRALPSIVAARPETLYVVLGATHPHLVAKDGEAYRHSLESLAETLGVRENVKFVDAYVDMAMLLDYLSAADVYVTPYLHEAQITSGTLAYALALGKPIVSTPFWHAKEALEGGVGALVDFANSEQIAEAITHLLVNDTAREQMSKRAYAAGRDTIWASVGDKYARVMEDALTTSASPPKRVRRQALPALSFQALHRMTDACGMLQHARFAVPDRNHGYCVDDNARALLLTQRAGLLGGNRLDGLAHTYAAFLEHAWNPDEQAFRNFMSYDRRWLERAGSHDSFGRAFWALGESAQLARDSELKRWAKHLASRAAPRAVELGSLRTRAFVILGLLALRQAGEPSNGVSELTQSLAVALQRARRDDWVWFEDVLAYDNARLCEALLRAGAALQRPDFIQAGLETLDWLMTIQHDVEGTFAPVGCESFGRCYERPARYDQQPIEACAAIDACWAAFDATGDQRWALEAHRAFSWFVGGNGQGVRMALPETGGCYDGLARHGPNYNQGAESILSYLLALCAMRARQRSPEHTFG